MIEPNGKTVLVAAGAADIAAAVAQRLAAEGFAVVLVLPDGGNAIACLTAIHALGGRAAAIGAALRQPAAMHALFDHAAAISGKLDVLVSDADIMQLSPLADADEASFKRHVAINDKGVLSGVREAARRLRPGGRIIGISASAGGLQEPSINIHSATAAGIKALARVLAAEVKAGELTLTAIALCPKASRTADAPSQTLMLPQDLGDAVAFLAQADRLAVDGRVLRVERVAVSSVRKQER